MELLPYSGHLWPLREEWEDDRPDFLVTLGLVRSKLRLISHWRWRARGSREGSRDVALLIVFILVRTAFFASFVETPEPRYVLECFPAVIALAAQVFVRARAQSLLDRLGMNRQAQRFAESVPSRDLRARR